MPEKWVMNFDTVAEFESKMAEYYGAPYAVATDSCTHGLELCIRHQGIKKITVPTRTYVSVPMLSNKLGLEWEWDNSEWLNYYYLGGTNIVDAAVYWEEGGYIPGTYMCLSFQFQKHLSLGRGGMILFDNKDSLDTLQKMVYDGRKPGIPWRRQNIDIMGYHYYMTPETAGNGLEKLEDAKQRTPRQWLWEEWPDLREMDVFK